jgi:hypothetical protein
LNTFLYVYSDVTSVGGKKLVLYCKPDDQWRLKREGWAAKYLPLPQIFGNTSKLIKGDVPNNAKI